jgi:hypothetical protein
VTGGNAEVFWLISQAIGWALTRDRELAEQIGGSSDPGSFGTQIAFLQSELRRKGRDINLELWKASGWTIPSPSGGPIRGIPFSSGDPIEDFDTITVFDAKMEGKTPVLSNVAEIANDRLRTFPIEHYLETLLRGGKLASLGRRLGEAEYRPLSPADWNDLELTFQVLEGNESVLVATPIRRRGIPESSPGECLLIQVRKADVLREFPTEPPVDEAPPPGAEATAEKRAPTDDEIDAVIKAAEKRLDRLLTLNNKGRNPGPQIVKDILKNNYPHLLEIPDVRVRKRLECLHRGVGPGPRRTTTKSEG